MVMRTSLVLREELGGYLLRCILGHDGSGRIFNVFLPSRINVVRFLRVVLLRGGIMVAPRPVEAAIEFHTASDSSSPSAKRPLPDARKCPDCSQTYPASKSSPSSAMV